MSKSYPMAPPVTWDEHILAAQTTEELGRLRRLVYVSKNLTNTQAINMYRFIDQRERSIIARATL